MKLIDKDALVAEVERLKECNRKICAGDFDFLRKTYPEHYYSTEIYNSILSFLDTLEVIEIGVDLGDPKGDKSAEYIIDTKTLEVKGVDLMIHTIIAECCDWLAMNTNLSHTEIEGCRNLMLTVKDEQLKAQKEEK